MGELAQAKLEFLRGFLKLAHVARSHDTFCRISRLIDPEQFGCFFERFMADFADACHGVMAIDGKVLRRSFDTASGKSAPHMVSACGCEQFLVLGRIAMPPTGRAHRTLRSVGERPTTHARRGRSRRACGD